jgi:hypothetical protein
VPDARKEVEIRRSVQPRHRQIKLRQPLPSLHPIHRSTSQQRPRRFTNSRSWSDGGWRKEQNEISGLNAEKMIELPQLRGDLAWFSVEHGDPLMAIECWCSIADPSGFARCALSMRVEPRG